MKTKPDRTQVGSPFHEAQSLLDQGIDCTKAGRFGEAGRLFLQALELFESQPDGSERSKQLGLAADLYARAGHPDLGLMALQGLLESPARRENPVRYCADLLTLANSWNRLGRPDASVAVNLVTLDYALEHKRFADAASASTNLAISDANSGRLPQSLERLQQSLVYLTKHSHPETEAITRMTLLQVVDLMKADPAIAIDASHDLFTRLEKFVRQQGWQSIAPAFHRQVARYLEERPELDAVTWKHKTFPQVFGVISK